MGPIEAILQAPHPVPRTATQRTDVQSRITKLPCSCWGLASAGGMLPTCRGYRSMGYDQPKWRYRSMNAPRFGCPAETAARQPDQSPGRRAEEAAMNIRSRDIHSESHRQRQAGEPTLPALSSRTACNESRMPAAAVYVMQAGRSEPCIG